MPNPFALRAPTTSDAFASMSWMGCALADMNGARTRTALSAASTRVYLSIASVWEIAIKLSRGPALHIGPPLSEFMEAAVASGLLLLQIAPEHQYEVQRLPWHHKDPFDRLIAAQSLTEKIPVVGKD